MESPSGDVAGPKLRDEYSACHQETTIRKKMAAIRIRFVPHKDEEMRRESGWRGNKWDVEEKPFPISSGVLPRQRYTEQFQVAGRCGILLNTPTAFLPSSR